MKIFGIFCVISIFCYANVSSQTAPFERKVKSLPIVEAFISGLEREPWSPDDGACLRATLDMLRGVGNNTLWATWMWDSMQLPTGSLYGAQAYLGNYDQCLQAPWSADHPGLRSQYCLLEIRGPSVLQTKTLGAFDDTEEYYRTPTADGRVFNNHFFGVCLPSVCSSSSVIKISRVLLQLSHLPDGEVLLDTRDCQTAGEEVERPTGYFVFWSFIWVLVMLSIISTISNNNDTKQNALGIIGKSFCLKRNYGSLTSTSPDEVMVMHGMRVFTALTIVFIHELYLTILTPSANGLELNKVMDSLIVKLTLHVDIVVDTFFTMSGLLLVRGLMLGKQKNLFNTLLKRYFRLVGPFAFCILFMVTVGEHILSGPMAKMLMRCETEICEKYWWKSLLMANTDVRTLCHAVSWYISCDFQLAVLGTFIFYVFKKNRKLGVFTFVTVALGFTVNLGLNVYWKQLPVLPFGYKTVVLKRDAVSVNDVYISSHARVGSYLVGLIMGYIITEYKPAQYRKVITKFWSSTIVGISILVISILMGLGAIFADRPYDPLEAAVVVATNRVIWAIAVCCIIAVCEYGSLTLLPSFLGWKVFVPLSKLSYCVYLLHLIAYEMLKFSLRNPVPFLLFNTITNTLGVLVLTGCWSLVLYLVLEAPIINISNELFSRTSPSGQNCSVTNKNSTIKQNDQNGLKMKAF